MEEALRKAETLVALVSVACPRSRRPRTPQWQPSRRAPRHCVSVRPRQKIRTNPGFYAVGFTAWTSLRICSTGYPGGIPPKRAPPYPTLSRRSISAIKAQLTEQTFSGLLLSRTHSRFLPPAQPLQS